MSNEEKLQMRIEELQGQLQQSDKLASLGVLSAGIAHEIQNPLNFVINFSQMSNDMVDDLEDLFDERGIDLDSEENAEIADTLHTLRSYLAKIAEHGHRATDIIQGILLYSRGKADQFMPTDLPSLLKKYVWLSFHAMRANLADFNVTIHEVYDPQITTVDLIPQDFSRAIINLMNNACYAVWKKQQNNPPSDYVPTVTVQTALSAEAFFTTKPVGEGTGLGLSITRSIIEQKHQGRISFESEEGRFTRFVVEVPLRHT